MVNLTRIYTRTGDKGTTRLSDGSMTNKTDPRLDAYGTVDEANTAIGVVLATAAQPGATALHPRAAAVLGLIQNELFDVGADLANPVSPNPKRTPLRTISASIDRLEKWCDEFGADLPNLKSFVLPGGTVPAAQLHTARVIVRRAERYAWLAAEVHGLEDGTAEPQGGINVLAIRYLNRLSDLLFIMARHANIAAGSEEVLWVPGGDREGNAG